MDSILIPLKEVTEKATIPQVKYWVKLAGISLVVVGRVAHVQPEDARILRQIAEMVSSGTSPQDAVKAVGRSPDHPIITTPDQPASVTLPQDSPRLESLERGVLALIDTFKKEMASLRADNEALRAEVSGLRFRLEAPPEPPKPATPRSDPGMVLVKRIEEKPVQRDAVSAWEGIRLAFDDLLGFAFGRG